MQKDTVWGPFLVMCSHSTEIMQEMICSPAIIHTQFVFGVNCIMKVTIFVTMSRISLKTLQFLSGCTLGRLNETQCCFQFSILTTQQNFITCHLIEFREGQPSVRYTSGNNGQPCWMPPLYRTCFCLPPLLLFPPPPLISQSLCNITCCLKRCGKQDHFKQRPTV